MNMTLKSLGMALRCNALLSPMGVQFILWRICNIMLYSPLPPICCPDLPNHQCHNLVSTEPINTGIIQWLAFLEKSSIPIFKNLDGIPPSGLAMSFCASLNTTKLLTNAKAVGLSNSGYWMPSHKYTLGGQTGWHVKALKISNGRLPLGVMRGISKGTGLSNWTRSHI